MAAALDMRPTVCGRHALCKLRPNGSRGASGCGGDSVAPGPLRQVEGVIRGLDQGVDRRAPFAIRGNPHADRELETAPTNRLPVKVVPHVRPKSLGGEA